MDEFLRKECDLRFFHENGYYRKKCEKCGAYFWTLDENDKLCGDQPCVEFSFIDNPLGKRPMSLSEVRESFLSFFEKNGHSRLKYPVTGERCPVVARWRTDIYLTIASIADFQPHVTSGEVPPPANPLVISQPCIRLNDLEEVGVSGRHLTTFEMMGHHAFNKDNDEIYFKDKTVDLCNKYFTESIGIKKEDIKYKEQLWFGGGNAGPCLEVVAGGLEIATLVFMNMVEDKNGDFEINGLKYSENPLNIVDTGYGLERIAWCTQGSKTVYDSVFPDMINWLKNNIEKEKRYDSQSLYSLADHSKCLSFMLGDGIVPSNVKAGYLARLIIRRSLRFIEKLKLSKTLREVVYYQLDLLKKDFPSLIENRKQIGEILDLETKKYLDTISKGKNLVKRILTENKEIEVEDLIKLYDTYGMPPEIVKKIAGKKGVKIEIPENFDSMVAELHSHEDKTHDKKEEKSDLPKSEKLYYDDHYKKEFDAKVIWSDKKDENETWVILDKTAFYPEGGGQPGDYGAFIYNGKKINVKNTIKQDEAIIHIVDIGLERGDTVKGQIDWDRRYSLMKHHTGTHLVNGALRKILGEHIWQAGSQLGVKEARFDYAHYEPISNEQMKKIEKLANDYIKKEVKVTKKVMDRNSAEKEYGFRLYQGGVPPGNSIRVLDIPGIDFEACGGTHLNNTAEIEKIKIIKTERVQDGVNRVSFAAGRMVDEFQNEKDKLYQDLIESINSYYKINKHDNKIEELEKVCEILSVQEFQIKKTLSRFLKEADFDEIKQVNSLSQACSDLFERWKESQKSKKKVSSNEIDQFIDEAVDIPKADVRVAFGTTSSDAIKTAGEIIKQGNFVAHIYDGKKLVSMASDNVDIDLRDFVPDISSILGGGGGGRQKMIQCGGPNKEKVDEALKKAKDLTVDYFKK